MEKTSIFHVRNQFKVLFTGIVLIILCYIFVDKPVVFWANAHHLQQYYWLELLTHLDDILSGMVFVIYLVLWLRFLIGKKSRQDRAVLVIANSYVIAAFLVVILKFVFARYWPDTWVNNNLSLLHDGAYGFNWFHLGAAYESFPSGHTARVVAAMMAVCLVYPRWRWLAGLVILLTAAGLIGVYYHFVSDVIAGTLLGYVVATTIYSISGVEKSR
jgi:membrane-associated phospholipid phosphatase